MAKLRNISKETLVSIVERSTSLLQVCNKIDLRGGGAIKSIRKRLHELQIDFSHFTGQTWNKGLTKEDHKSIARCGEHAKIRLTGSKGFPHSEETKRRLSESRTRYLESHHDHGIAWYDVICPNNNCTIKVQGTWERKFALWLNSHDIAWTRTSLRFQNHRTYTPDFYLVRENFYVEVKGFWRDRDIHKMYLVLDEHDIDIRYVDKSNIDALTLTLPKFVETFKRENINKTLFVDHWSSDVTAAM